MLARAPIVLSVTFCLAIACDGLHAQSPDQSTARPRNLWNLVKESRPVRRLTQAKDAVTKRFHTLPALKPEPAVDIPRAAPVPTAAPELASGPPTVPVSAAMPTVARGDGVQKQEALRTLAHMDCACHDRDGELTESLLAAMRDPDEPVRLAAIEAIADAMSSGPCPRCNERRCANEQILDQLVRTAYEQAPSGAPQEPSPRVRRAAIETLALCDRPQAAVEQPGLLPTFAPSGLVRGARPEPAARMAEPAARMAEPAARMAETAPDEAPRDLAHLFETAVVAASISDKPTASDAQPGEDIDEHPGAVVEVDYQRKVARVRFLAEGVRPDPGGKLLVYRPDNGQYALLGELEVLDSSEGAANVRPSDGFDLARLVPGVVVVVP